MKKLLLGLAVFAVLNLNAQNYQITFTGSGASTSVTSVTAENLTSGAIVTLNGTDILDLTVTTGINSPRDYEASGLKIYPNPMTDYSTLEIYPPVRGEALITISEITGKPVAREKIKLENIRQGFRVTGLKNGFYMVDVKGNGFTLSGKIISNGNANSAIRIEKDNSITQTIEEKDLKTPTKAAATVNMAYTTGEVLKFTGASGNYSTIITDIPTGSKVINFNFVECTDGDYNVYPVVVIGTQTWMAENLKTITYNDHTAIPNVTLAATWTSTTSGAYADYLNTPTYSDTYGRLYNWYAVASTNTKNVCPTGWHVATDEEWTTLVTYLGGEALAGGKLKETGTAHWLTPNTSATNKTGFTALPGGYRNTAGTFGLMGNTGYWWSSIEGGTTFAWYYYIYFGTGNITRLDHEKHFGSSVRCLMD